MSSYPIYKTISFASEEEISSIIRNVLSGGRVNVAVKQNVQPVQPKVQPIKQEPKAITSNANINKSDNVNKPNVVKQNVEPVKPKAEPAQKQLKQVKEKVVPNVLDKPHKTNMIINWIIFSISFILVFVPFGFWSPLARILICIPLFGSVVYYFIKWIKRKNLQYNDQKQSSILLLLSACLFFAKLFYVLFSSLSIAFACLPYMACSITLLIYVFVTTLMIKKHFIYDCKEEYLSILLNWIGFIFIAILFVINSFILGGIL